MAHPASGLIQKLTEGGGSGGEIEALSNFLVATQAGTSYEIKDPKIGPAFTPVFPPIAPPREDKKDGKDAYGERFTAIEAWEKGKVELWPISERALSLIVDPFSEPDQYQMVYDVLSEANLLAKPPG